MNDYPEFITPDVIENNIPAGRFLKKLFARVPSDCWLELYFMLDKELPSVKGKPRKFTAYVPMPFHREIPDVPDIVTENNALGYGVYFGTTPSLRKIEPVWKVSEDGREYKMYPRRHEGDIPFAPVLWIDVDDCSLDDFWTRHGALKGLNIEPSCVVSSGGGIHAYWVLNEPFALTGEAERKHFKRLLKAMAVAYGADTNATDLARIMRLPSTVNTKPKRNGARCEVVSNWVSVASMPTMERYYHRFYPRELPRPTHPLPHVNSDEIPPVTRKYLNSPPFEGERNARLYSASRGCLDMGMTQSEAERLLLSTAISTGLDESEALTTINSAYRAPRNFSNQHISTRKGINDERTRKK